MLFKPHIAGPRGVCDEQAAFFAPPHGIADAFGIVAVVAGEVVPHAVVDAVQLAMAMQFDVAAGGGVEHVQAALAVGQGEFVELGYYSVGHFFALVVYHNARRSEVKMMRLQLRFQLKYFMNWCMVMLPDMELQRRDHYARRRMTARLI